jgi:hypothetical protein
VLTVGLRENVSLNDCTINVEVCVTISRDVFDAIPRSTAFEYSTDQRTRRTTNFTVPTSDKELPAEETKQAGHKAVAYI